MCDDDGLEPIADIVERLVNGLAPAGEESPTGASRHGGGGKTAVILQFPKRVRAEASWPLPRCERR